jgi:hypothetical protein
LESPIKLLMAGNRIPKEIKDRYVIFQSLYLFYFCNNYIHIFRRCNPDPESMSMASKPSTRA